MSRPGVPSNRRIPPGIACLDNYLCGCGSPELVWGLFARMLAAYSSGARVNPKDDPGLWLAVYLFDHCGLTEHGVGVSCAWITELGREAAHFMEQHPNWFEEPDWYCREGVLRTYGE